MKKQKDILDAFNETLKEFDQIEYIKDYNKETYRRYSLMIRKDNTAVIEKLESQPSKNAYIISLIEKDIGK